MKRVLAFSVALGLLICGINLKSETQQTYLSGEPISVYVNSMTSAAGVMPYGHYSVKTCVPLAVRTKLQSLGDAMVGNWVESSDYVLELMKNVSCRQLCGPIPMTQADMDLLTERIEQEYRGNLLLDNLPVVEYSSIGGSGTPVSIGYPLGVPAKNSGQGKTLIYNHLQFRVTVQYDPLSSRGGSEYYSIVAFSVAPYSVYRNSAGTCLPNGPSVTAVYNPPLTSDATTISWTYGVEWVEDRNPALTWANRWDLYVREGAGAVRVRWLGLINSLIMVFLLYAMAGTCIIRMRRKAAESQSVEQSEEESEEALTNWKLLANDVSRVPVALKLLAALVGYGAQLGCLMIFGSVYFNFAPLPPLDRLGELLTAGLQLFSIFGFLAGYVAGQVLKLCGVRPHSRHALVMGVGLPFAALALYLTMNYVQRSHGATTALPLTATMALVFLLLLVAAPLFLLGCTLASRGGVALPTAFNKVLDSTPPREIPPRKWYLKRYFAAPTAGLMAFSVCFIELHFILSSLWVGPVYNHVEFAILTFILFTAATSAVSMLSTLLLLNAEDYRWWWNSWISGASSGGFVFLYSLYYLMTKLRIDHSAGIFLYVGYMAMISAMLALYGAAVGFVSSWRLVNKMHSSLAEKDVVVEVPDEPIDPPPRVGVEEQEPSESVADGPPPAPMPSKVDDVCIAPLPTEDMMDSFDIPSKSEFVSAPS